MIIVCAGTVAMSRRPRLEQRQRQTQTLAMTPELQQAIRLLQMSNLELHAFIATELERNPLLEIVETDEPEERRAANREEADAPRQEEPTPQETLTEAFAREAPSEARMQSMDMNPADVFEEAAPSDQPTAPPAGEGGAWSGVSGGGRGFDDSLPDLEATVSGGKSLREHLLEQMELTISEPTERLIARQIVEQLDSDGFLREPLEDIAEKLGTGVTEVEAVLERLQGLEPAGVFARDLAECFRLQLLDQGALDAPMAALLEHLDLLAARDFEALARACGVDVRDLPGMVERLKRLDPRPGAAFAPEPMQLAIPDVFVRAAPDGSWLVELNGETLPKVLVNNAYRALVKSGQAAEKDREFIHDCTQRANWLVKSLDQRARTILAVAREIVRRQDAFFTRGVAGLKPLTLRQVADALGMHESTISRVVANKFMATPRGIFEFRYFFTTAIASTDGEEAVSAEAVRHRIRELIDAEEPDKVLSDDAIVAILKKEGIDIARRTVAKYRESMGIPSSPKRRREKKMLAKLKG